MAHLKATPKTYEQAAAILNGRTSLKLGNNTWLEDHSCFIAVRLHRSRIVVFWPDGHIVLWTDGYQSVTTKDRINQFIAGRVYQKDYKWFYQLPGKTDSDADVPFTEGMNVATKVKCPHSPHDPDTLQTVCDRCDATIEPITPDSDVWQEV